MGSACAKSSNANQNPHPVPPIHHNQNIERPPNTRQAQLQNIMNTDYASHLNIEHGLNINHKFADYFTIINNAFSGQGIKKTYSYISHLSKEDLIKKREEFWDTRTEGRVESWQTIRAAIFEKEEANSLAFLKASGLNLVKNSLQFVYDEHGKKYEIPAFCMNEPSKYELKPNSTSVLPNFKIEIIKMKIRCAIGKDAEVELENTTSIKKLKELYYKQASIDSKEYPIDFSRLFYKGKEMKENHQLGEYNLENECVVQLFVRKRDCN